MKNIEERLNELRIEQVVLNKTHDEMVAIKQKQDQEFQERVGKNQVRFRQLEGAIAELESLLRSDDAVHHLNARKNISRIAK